MNFSCDLWWDEENLTVSKLRVCKATLSWFPGWRFTAVSLVHYWCSVAIFFLVMPSVIRLIRPLGGDFSIHWSTPLIPTSICQALAERWPSNVCQATVEQMLSSRQARQASVEQLSSNCLTATRQLLDWCSLILVVYFFDSLVFFFTLIPGQKESTQK